MGYDRMRENDGGLKGSDFGYWHFSRWRSMASNVTISLEEK